MVRCPQCGLRLHEAAPTCPTHGAVPSRISEPPPPSSPLSETPPHGVESAFAAEGYRITGKLGHGGFAVVYAAERERDALSVALKVGLGRPAEAAEQLSREAAALEAVGPPYAPAVYEQGSANGKPFLALELIAAPTLATLLTDEAKALTLERFGEIARGVLTAVEAVHVRGFVHLDLKPENLFLIGTGKVRIIDFGLAAPQTASERVGVVGAEGVGTAEYMSPEQCDGVSDLDLRSDLYSLGALFYEMLSGAPPFWGHAADVREAQRSLRPMSLLLKIGCSSELSQTITRCLAKDRARRFESVAALRRALDAALLVRARSTPPSWKPVASQSGVPLAGAVRVSPSMPREKRTVGLVFFESRAGVASVQAVVTACGGQIVEASAALYVAAFGHDVAANPARMALVAAHRLCAQRLSTRCLVDVASVSVQLRIDGSRRLFSPLFTKKGRFPTATEPAGVSLTAAATQAIPDLQVTAVEGHADRFVLDTTVTPSESTTFGVQLAPLVGRDEVLAELTQSARRALERAEPTVMTVSAEAGYGRTHLASSLGHLLDQLQVKPEVIRLVAEESLVGAVSQLLPELMRRVLGLPTDAPEDGGRALLLERLGASVGEQVWAGAAFALGWIDVHHVDVRRLAAAPGALRLATARACGEALRRRARQRPIALVLDDAHLADEGTLDALEYGTLKEASARLWVCVLVKPSFGGARPNWATRAAHADRIQLGTLAAGDAIELTRHLLLPVEHVPPLALTRLAERAQGVPRLLIELVRGLKRDGLIRRSERGTGHYLATDELDKLPDLPILQWNASREVEALPAMLGGHARLCSVFGASFTLGEVEELLSILEREELPQDMQLDASVGLQRLLDAKIVARHRGGLFDFRHPLLRDTIYELVPEPQRKKLHRAAFEMYRASTTPNAQRLPRFAFHAAHCGETAAAASAYLELAERAAATQAYLEAEAAFGRALEHLLTDDERVIAAMRGRGLMRFRLSRHEDALKDLERARELAEARGDVERVMELLLDAATVLDWTRDMKRSAELVREVQAYSPSPTGLLAVRLALGAARVHHRQGEGEICARLGREAATQALAFGDAGYETRVIALLMVGVDCSNLGRLEEAEQHFSAVIAETKAHADLHHLGAAYCNRSFLWFARKDVPRLIDDLMQTTSTAREIGEPLMEYIAACNLGEVRYSLAELESASEHTRRAIELAAQSWGELSLEVANRQLLLARIALYGEQLEQARELADRVSACLIAEHASGTTAGDFTASDEALLEMVRLGARNASESEWEALAVRTADLSLQPLEEVELIESRALSAYRNGLHAESRALFERALEVSKSKPNLLSERVAQKLTLLFGSDLSVS